MMVVSVKVGRSLTNSAVRVLVTFLEYVTYRNAIVYPMLFLICGLF